MKAVAGKDFCKLLQKKGWSCARINGSHHIYTKPGHAARISVPVHGSQSLKRGLQRQLMKLAEISEDEL